MLPRTSAVMAASSATPMSLVPPDNAEIREVLRRQIRLLEEDRGSRALLEMRKHLSHYCRGKTGSAKLRERINSVSTRSELEELVELLFPDGEPATDEKNCR